MNEWLNVDQLLLVTTNVQGRLNVQTIVSKAGSEYSVYAFSDHASERAGPISIEEYPLPTEDVSSSLEKEHVITINSPVSVRVTWAYEKIGEVPVGVIDELRIRDSEGNDFLLTSDGADYPTSLRLA